MAYKPGLSFAHQLRQRRIYFKSSAWRKDQGLGGQSILESKGPPKGPNEDPLRDAMKIEICGKEREG